MTASLVGTRFELEIGPVAHGGHCVGRHDGRVVFVRHALPGEHVLVEVTEDRGGAYCRADAVEVLTASPDRVTPPCPFAGPGRCGGCDWQHASPVAQRRLKAIVVREQLERLGAVVIDDLPGGLPDEAEELPGGSLGWRTRVQFAVDADGVPGLRRHRSHEVIRIDRCLIATAAVDGVGVLGQRWPGAEAVEAIASSRGDRAVVVHPAPAQLPTLADGVSLLAGRDAVRGHRRVREVVGERPFLVAVSGFWQVHPAAAATLTAGVLEALSPRQGDRALDLYCGVGLFAAALAGPVRGEYQPDGPSGAVVAAPDAPAPAVSALELPGGGEVLGVESDGDAVANARRNLRDHAHVRIERGRVEHVLGRLALDGADIVVLDPPRSGAGAAVVTEIAALRPRAVAYVACDPAALARDVRTFAGLGYQLQRVRVLDAFPMTSHIECVATLTPAGPPAHPPSPIRGL